MTQKTAAIDWAGRARELAPAIAAAGDRNERERRIAPEIIAAIDQAGHLMLAAGPPFRTLKAEG